MTVIAMFMTQLYVAEEKDSLPLQKHKHDNILELEAFWHPEKNGDLKPDGILPWVKQEGKDKALSNLNLMHKHTIMHKTHRSPCA